jgi:hypothetical protein
MPCRRTISVIVIVSTLACGCQSASRPRPATQPSAEEWREEHPVVGALQYTLFLPVYMVLGLIYMLSGGNAGLPRC